MESTFSLHGDQYAKARPRYPQAPHRFDYEKFWPQVRRVARPGAFFCAWGYDWPLLDGQLMSR